MPTTHLPTTTAFLQQQMPETTIMNTYASITDNYRLIPMLHRCVNLRKMLHLHSINEIFPHLVVSENHFL